ncbi:X2-like carbohydrate binding domain-containing protein [uncultured Megasphaera sp.]|uniref:X2-like carbohydrate binding domain-containing protein n=1 Tax=uncultured Megasphaera sp. TaxID=165188 RepID=UPI0034A04BE7
MVTAVSPETATVSIAAAADLAFTVAAATGVTVKTITNASATVNGSNYTYAAGILTLKSAYLASQTAGTKTFTVTMSDGSTATFTVTVTA